MQLEQMSLADANDFCWMRCHRHGFRHRIVMADCAGDLVLCPMHWSRLLKQCPNMRAVYSILNQAPDTRAKKVPWVIIDRVHFQRLQQDR